MSACTARGGAQPTAEQTYPDISPSPNPIATELPSQSAGTPSPSPTIEVTPSPIPTPTPKETLSPEEKLLTPHLADVAKKAGITKIGVEFGGNAYLDKDWAKITTEQFNSVTLDWGLDWTTIEPSRGKFDFSIIDKQLPFIEAHKLSVRGHPLVETGGDSPQWIKDGHYSKSELKQILINHVKTIVSRYKGVISEWVVVNEPYIYPYRTGDIFYDTFGYNYIDIAFKAAREADPSAKLIYNDTENHRSDSGAFTTTALTQETVKRLKSKGLIDMVGLQMHLDGSFYTTKQDMINVMRSYGVPVVITEFDISLNTVKGTKAQRFALQAKLATAAVSACRQSKVCKEITFWGIGDKDSWLEVFMGEKNADATPFDDNLKPKPFYFAVRKALS